MNRVDEEVCIYALGRHQRYYSIKLSRRVLIKQLIQADGDPATVYSPYERERRPMNSEH